MSSRILSLLTTVAVVLHALLGCCAHHSHAYQQLACEDARETVRTSCGCHHSGAGSPSVDELPADEESGHHRHGHDEPCNGPKCQFLGVERTDHVDQVLSLPVWFPRSDVGDVATGTCSVCWTPSLDQDTHRSGVCVRAATQVWLL